MISPANLVCIARGLRDFGDGYVAVLFPVYLIALGLGPFEVGLAATLALLGSAATTLTIGFVGARTDHRRLLMLASLLMTATGLAFAASQTVGLILLVAFIGTINPTAGSVSIFAPIEQSVLTRLAATGQRTRLFARYGLVGALAAATGSLAAGGVDIVAAHGIDRLVVLRAMFVVYAALGVAGGLVFAALPPEPVAAEGASARAPLGPSRAFVFRLAALFSVDSFASGFAVQSLLALWLFDRFGLSLEAAALFFFWSGLLGASSYPVAARLAQRIGLVNTMVYTHIPANLCLIAAALSPSLGPALALLLVRSFLSQMDVPARSSFVMAAVTPAERPAAASVTSVPRSLATAASPAIAGALYAAGYTALPLLLCGALKTAYDLALLYTCRHLDLPED